MTATRRYDHLYIRQEYPQERGYKMESVPLPDWMYINVTTDVDIGSKHLTVCSRIHVNKEVRVGPSYSDAFTDQEILKDLSGEVYHRFIL